MPQRAGVTRRALALALVVLLVVAVVAYLSLEAATPKAPTGSTTTSVTATSDTTPSTSATQTTSQVETSSSSTSTTLSSTCSISTPAGFNTTVTLAFLKMVQTFSAATLTAGENTSQGPLLQNFSYSLSSTSADGSLSLYKVNLTESYNDSGNAVTFPATVWILSNGTVLAADVSGENVTGRSAYPDFAETAGPLLLVAEYDSYQTGLDEFLPFSSIHASTDSQVAIGATEMNATNYIPYSMPIIFGDCATTFTLNTFVMQAGVVPGTDFDLLSHLDMQGTEQATLTPEQYSVLLEVVSMTVAQPA